MPPTVYLARHGETEWSKSGQHTGRTDIPLTTAGREADGHRLGERLAARTSPESSAARSSRPADRGTGGLLARDRAGPAGMGLRRVRREDQRRDSRGPAGLETVPRRVPRRRIGRRGGRARRSARRRSSKDLTGNVLCFAHGHLLRVLAARWVGQPVTLRGPAAARHRDRQRPQLRPRQAGRTGDQAVEQLPRVWKRTMSEKWRAADFGSCCPPLVQDSGPLSLHDFATHRYVRPTPQQPPRLRHRPLQPPLHVLHAGGRDLPRPLRAAHLRGDRAVRARRGRRSASTRSG